MPPRPRRVTVERSFIQRGAALPRSPAQFDRIREESRERILDAALTLFARHGYVSTTVRMLAAEAGISQGLLYNYFDDKHALLRAIFERSMGDVQEDISGLVEAASPVEALGGLVRAAFETLRANPEFWKLSYQVRMQPAVLEELATEVGEWSGLIVSQIEAVLRAAGAPRPGARARALFAAIDGAAQHWTLLPEAYPLDDVADELIMLVGALAGGSAHESSGEEEVAS